MRTKSRMMKMAQNTISSAIDTLSGTKKTLRKMDWNRTMRNASSIAGTIGSALFMARSMRRRTGITGMSKIGKIFSIGSASIGMLAGGMRLFNDYAPDQSRRMQKNMRKTYNRYRKRVAF